MFGLISCLSDNWGCFNWGSDDRLLGGGGSLGSLGWGHDFLWLLFLFSLNDSWLLVLGSFSLDFNVMSSSSILGSPGIIDLLVFFSKSNVSFSSFDFLLLLDAFSSQSSLSDEPLDLGGFVSGGFGVLFALEGPSDGVLLDEGN